MKRRKQHKQEHIDTDSLWSILSNKKSLKGGKTIQQMLGIEDKGMEPLGGKPLKMMDIINSIDSMYETGEDDEEEG